MNLLNSLVGWQLNEWMTKSLFTRGLYWLGNILNYYTTGYTSSWLTDVDARRLRRSTACMKTVEKMAGVSSALGWRYSSGGSDAVNSLLVLKSTVTYLAFFITVLFLQLWQAAKF